MILNFCPECGAKVILKCTSNFNGVLSKYWKCPVCGHEHEETQKNILGEVLLK